MKKVWIMMVLVGVLVFGFAAGAMANLVTFNFDPSALPNGSNAAAIGAYMTGIYGPTVTVTGNSPTSETGILTLLGGIGDGYIESEPSGGHLIQINFAAPINSASFDWGQYYDEFHADYSLNGTAWTEFYSKSYNSNFFGNTGNSGTLSLPNGVIALRFHDDGTGEVGIDNLV